MVSINQPHPPFQADRPSNQSVVHHSIHFKVCSVAARRGRNGFIYWLFIDGGV